MGVHLWSGRLFTYAENRRKHKVYNRKRRNSSGKNLINQACSKTIASLLKVYFTGKGQTLKTENIVRELRINNIPVIADFLPQKINTTVIKEACWYYNNHYQIFSGLYLVYNDGIIKSTARRKWKKALHPNAVHKPSRIART